MDTSTTPRQSLDEYRRQYKADAGSADKTLLEAVRQALEVRLKSVVLDKEDVHVAVDFSLYFGEGRTELVSVLWRYLDQTLEVEEEAWTRWKLVDNLALLERSEEAMSAQRDFFQWASRELTRDELVWVMYDSTQALCWVIEGRGDEWLEIFWGNMSRCEATAKNRRDRLVYLETASVVLDKMQRPLDMLRVSELVRGLSQEDLSWDRTLEAQITVCQIQVRAYTALHKLEELHHAARIATDLLQRRGADANERGKLWIQYHNMGATLYLAGQYELAIPLLRRAIELGSYVEHSFLWLAASLWQQKEDKEEVLALLRQGRERAVGGAGAGSLGYDRWKQLPEFKDVVDDFEFQEAISQVI